MSIGCLFRAHLALFEGLTRHALLFGCKKGAAYSNLEYPGLILLHDPACLRSRTNPQTVILHRPHL